MNLLNVCFIGIGSIARRHIKNLKTICNAYGIKLNIDAVRRSFKKKLGDEILLFRKVYTKCEELDMEYDVIFITNPTEYHIKTLIETKDMERNFL